MKAKKDKNIYGDCALCGKYKKLSFEHVPPQSAFNNKPIFRQTHEHLTDSNSFVYGLRMRSNKGSGGYTLCESCNNDTGDWYARDFSDFAHQGVEILKNSNNPFYVNGFYQIKPLNVFKQILTMFIAIDKSGILRSNKALVNFILNKESIECPIEYKVYLYYTLSVKYRMMGYSFIMDPKLGFQKWSEINFPPFGYVLAEDSLAPFERMVDLTDFKNYKYDEKSSIEFIAPYLIVESPWIGTYKFIK
jgi:hypothetical protein